MIYAGVCDVVMFVVICLGVWRLQQQLAAVHGSFFDNPLRAKQTGKRGTWKVDSDPKPVGKKRYITIITKWYFV